MKWNGIIFVVIFLFITHRGCEGLFGGASFQDYVDRVVDVAKLQLDGVVNLNDSAINNIWMYFKTKYGRVYSTVGE